MRRGSVTLTVWLIDLSLKEEQIGMPSKTRKMISTKSMFIDSLQVFSTYHDIFQNNQCSFCIISKVKLSTYLLYWDIFKKTTF